ncbi:MAG: hypothetical protein H6R43_402 [Nitrospirae bacterium]|nr:hypothetical protein [Nitrospirota bacterium]
MKKLICMTVMLAFVFACKEKPKNPVSEYGDTMINSYQKGKQAGEDGNLDAVRKAIQAYHATYDKYPLNLEELKPLINSELDFSKYDYHPENGTVSPKVN